MFGTPPDATLIDFTDDHLQLLFPFHTLEHLNVGYTGVTDAGLHELERFKITWLHLDGCQITDAGLARLAGVSTIQWLFLPGTQVTDSGIKHLAKLKQLKTLDLNGCEVSDESISHLESLRNLEKLRLRGTQISPQGFLRLQRGLPRTHISYGPSPLVGLPRA